MHTLTQIRLDNDEMALYLDGYYLGSEDNSGDKMSLSEIETALLQLPTICQQVVLRPMPEQEDWSWNEVAEPVFSSAAKQTATMTVGAFMSKLSRYPIDALCCGTFWMADDFLALDETLTHEEIDLAMEIADDTHDANIGFNWEHLFHAITKATE